VRRLIIEQPQMLAILMTVGMAFFVIILYIETTPGHCCNFFHHFYKHPKIFGVLTK
jgi:hypothetical protein